MFLRETSTRNSSNFNTTIRLSFEPSLTVGLLPGIVWAETGEAA
jgi:hypothetical protein